MLEVPRERELARAVEVDTEDTADSGGKAAARLLQEKTDLHDSKNRFRPTATINADVA